MDILILLINGQEELFYATLLANQLIPFLILYLNRKLPIPAEGNPAERRKKRAAKRQALHAAGAAALTMVLVLSLFGFNQVYASRKVELSEAVPVKAQGSQVLIPLEDVQDGNLQRFAFNTSGGTKMQFIVIHKGSGIYGVGLDACEICGTTGYYQRRDKVVCLNCDVVINVPTIGFPGGCNPVPVTRRVDGQNLVIETRYLEKKAAVYAGW